MPQQRGAARRERCVQRRERLEKPASVRIRVVVVDSGPGLPEGFDIGSSPTLGLELVRSLTRQLRGELTASSEGGARFEVVCPHAS